MTNEILMLPLRDIRPYERNPRLNDDSVDAVANSISDFGIEHIDFVKKMDCGQEIYGGGALVSDAQAEKVKAEKVKAEKVKILIKLSERERESAEA